MIGVEIRITRKKYPGYVFMFTYNAFSQCSKKQTIVTLPSCEAKHVATSSVECQAIWSQNLLEFMHMKCDDPLSLQVNYNSTICLAKNPMAHERSNHIDTRYHFIRG